MTNFRNPLKLARNHGASGTGTGHFITQRVTAIIIAPLAIWLIIGIISHMHADLTAMRAWIGHPVNAGLLSLLLIASFWHAAIGLGEIIQDYVHCATKKLAALLAVNVLCGLLGLVSTLAVVKLLLV